MIAWAGQEIAASAEGPVAAASTGDAGVSVVPPAGNRGEVRALVGVLSIIISLFVILIVLVALSAVRRRTRAAVSKREPTRKGRGTRRVDAWAEAGRRAVLADPTPPDEPEDGDDDEDEGGDGGKWGARA